VGSKKKQKQKKHVPALAECCLRHKVATVCSSLYVATIAL